ncbi:MAG: hypothetical protein QGI11_15720 [Nitrospinota bacterium]|nr:hypothetical protein [Nitrospinota bacterium]
MEAGFSERPALPEKYGQDRPHIGRRNPPGVWLAALPKPEHLHPPAPRHRVRRRLYAVEIFPRRQGLGG